MSESVVVITKGSKSSPLVVLNSFGDEWKQVASSLDFLGVTSYSLLAVSGFEWNRDLAPWKADAVFKGESDFEGGADQYLERLTGEIIPSAAREHSLEPCATYIAGYSMAGLFALYSLYKTDCFSGAASCSGSLWFPGFREFALDHEFMSQPSKIYMSLGDREAKTKNKVMAAVEENTLAVADLYRSKGLDVKFEMNLGGHFNESALRTAKGIAYLLGSRS